MTLLLSIAALATRIIVNSHEFFTLILQTE